MSADNGQSGRGRYELEDGKPELKVCPLMSTPESEQTCIGDRCHLWRRFQIQFSDGVKIHENCALVVQASLTLDGLGPLYQIAASAQQRVQPANIHPSFRK